MWRLNSVLLILGVYVWAKAASPESVDNGAYQAEFDRSVSSAESATSPVSRARLEAFLEVVRVFHGGDEEPQVNPASQPSGPVRPPLSAFRVAMFIRDGGADGDHGLVLRCKDPAHPETYVLSRSRVDRGTTLRQVRFLAEHAEFDVTRGEESFTFRTPLKPALDQSVLRIRGSERTPYQTRDLTSREAVAVFNSADLSAARSLKILGHRDKDGRAVGMRVTGLRPGGWAQEFGFQVGDIIETESTTQLRDPTALRDAVRRGWRPTHVTVRRVIWGETHRLSVDGT